MRYDLRLKIEGRSKIDRREDRREDRKKIRWRYAEQRGDEGERGGNKSECASSH